MEEISREQKSDCSPSKNAPVKDEDVSFNSKLLETGQILQPQGCTDSDRTRHFCELDIMLKRKNQDKSKQALEVETKHVNASIEHCSCLGEAAVEGGGSKQNGELDGENNDCTTTKGKHKMRKLKRNKIDADFEQLDKSKGADNTKSTSKVQFNETQCECAKSSKNRRSRKEKSKLKSNTATSGILMKVDVSEENDSKLGKILINKLETEVAATVISSDSTIFVKRFNNSDFSLDLLNYTKRETKNMKVHNNSLDSINLSSADVNDVKKSVQKAKSRKKTLCIEAPHGCGDDGVLKSKSIPLDGVKDELETEATKTKNRKRKKHVKSLERANKERVNTEKENNVEKTFNKTDVNQLTGDVKQQTNENESSVVKLFVVEKMGSSNSCTVLLGDQLCDSKPVVAAQGNVETPLELVCKDVATSTCDCKEKKRKRSKSKHKSTKNDKNTQETSETDIKCLIVDASKTNKVIVADKNNEDDKRSNKMSRKVRKSPENEVTQDKVISKHETELNYARYLNYDAVLKGKRSKRKSATKQVWNDVDTCFGNAMGDSYVNFQLPLKSQEVTYKQYQVKEYVKKTKYSRSKSWGADVRKPKEKSLNLLAQSHSKSGRSSDSDLHKNLLLLRRSKTLFRKDVGQASRKQNVVREKELVKVLALQDSEFPKNKTKVIQRTIHRDVQEEKNESATNLSAVKTLGLGEDRNQEMVSSKNSDNFAQFCGDKLNTCQQSTMVLYNRNKATKKKSKRKSFRREISLSQMNLTPLKHLYKKPSKKSLHPEVATVTKTQRASSYFKRFPNWDEADGCTLSEKPRQKLLHCTSGTRHTAERKLSFFHMCFGEKVVEISTKEIGDDGRMTVGFIVCGSEPAKRLKCQRNDGNKKTERKTCNLHVTLLTPIEIQDGTVSDTLETGEEKEENLEGGSNENETKPSDVKTGEERVGKPKAMSKKRTLKKFLVPRRIFSNPHTKKRSKRKSVTETASKRDCNVIATEEKSSAPEPPPERDEKKDSLLSKYETSLQAISEEVLPEQKSYRLEEKETQTRRESYDVERIKQILCYISKTIEETKKSVDKNETRAFDSSSTDTSSYYEQFKRNVRAKFGNMKKGDKGENSSAPCDRLGSERGTKQGADANPKAETVVASNSYHEKGKKVLDTLTPITSIASADVLCKAHLEKYSGTQELVKRGKIKRDASKTRDASMVTENQRSVPKNPLGDSCKALVEDNFGEGVKSEMDTRGDGVAGDDVATAEPEDVDRECGSKSIQVSVDLQVEEEVDGNEVKADDVAGADFASEESHRDTTTKTAKSKRSNHFEKLKRVFSDKRGLSTQRKRNNGKEDAACPKAQDGDYVSFLKLERHLEQLLGLYPSIFRAIRSHVNDSNAKHIDRQMKKEFPDLFPSQTTLATTVDTITEYKNIDFLERDPCSSQNVNLGPSNASKRGENLVEDFLKTYNFDLREFARNRTENNENLHHKNGFDCTNVPSNLSSNFSETEGRLRGNVTETTRYLVPKMNSSSDSSNQLPENWSTGSRFFSKITPTNSSSGNRFGKSVAGTKSVMMAKGCTSDLTRSKSLDEICRKNDKCSNKKCHVVKPGFKETSTKFLLLFPASSSKFFEMEEPFGDDKQRNVVSASLRKELKCAGHVGETNPLSQSDEEKKNVDELRYRNILFANRDNVVSAYVNYNSTPFYIHGSAAGCEEVDENSVGDDSAEDFSTDSLETTKSKDEQSFYADAFNPSNQTFLIYNSTVEYDNNYDKTIGKRENPKKDVETNVGSVQLKKTKLSDVSGNSGETSGTLLTESGYESNKSKKTTSLRNFFKKGGSLLDVFRSNKKQPKSCDETKLTNFTALFTKKKQTEPENAKTKKEKSTSTSAANESHKIYWHNVGKKPRSLIDKHAKEASTSNASTSTQTRTKHNFFKNKNTSTATNSNLKPSRIDISKEYRKQVDECHAYAEKVFLESQMRRDGYYKQYNDFKEIPLEQLIGKKVPCCSRTKCVESSSRGGSSSGRVHGQTQQNSQLEDKTNLKLAKSQEPRIVTEDETVKLKPDGLVEQLPLVPTDSLLLLRMHKTSSKFAGVDKAEHKSVVHSCNSIRDLPTRQSQTQTKTSDLPNAKKKIKKTILKTASKTKKGCLCRQETAKPKTSRHVTKEVVQPPIVEKTDDGVEETEEKIEEIEEKMRETEDEIEHETFLKQTTFAPLKVDFEDDVVVKTIMSDIVTKAVIEGELFMMDESDEGSFFEKYVLDISSENIPEEIYTEEKTQKVSIKEEEEDSTKSTDEAKKSLTDKEVFDKLLKSYEKTDDIAKRISNDEQFFREEIKNMKRDSDESFDDVENGIAADKKSDLKDVIYTDDIPKTAHRSTHFWEEKIRKMRASEVNPVKTDDIGTCFSRGFRPDNIALSGDACFNLNKQDKLKFTKGMLTDEESIIDFSERETPLDYLLALGFMVDEASNALKDDDIRNRLLAAITEVSIHLMYLYALVKF